MIEPSRERIIQRVGPFGLAHSDTRQRPNQAKLVQHQKTSAERADVAQVAAGDHHPIRHFPVELLHDFDGDGLLSLEPQ